MTRMTRGNLRLDTTEKKFHKITLDSTLLVLSSCTDCEILKYSLKFAYLDNLTFSV